MNTTKQKVLQQSLTLFNERGVSNVSLRAVADAAAISIGNLQYHFKKRDEIIEALYFQIVKKIDAIVAVPSDDLMPSILTISTRMMTVFFEYRFFFLDFPTIVRGNRKIKLNYAELSTRREMEFMKITALLIDKGYFRKEQLENEYQSLYRRTEVITNFWFSSILIQSNSLTKAAIEEYARLISQSIYPYLTEKAKHQFATHFV